MSEQQQHPEELLPWYVNGTLSADEAAQVEAHLGRCRRCADEVRALEAIRQQIKQSAEALPAEFFWQRLKRDMASANRRPGAGMRSWWMPGFAAAAVLTITIQSVLLFRMPADGVLYGLAGSAGGDSYAQVKFNPESREKDIRAVLQSVSAEIVTGPSARGIYRIQLDGEDDTVDRLIDGLRQQTAVVDFIERD